MLTIIGKILVFTTVIFSLVGLGLSIWSVADTTDFKGETDKVKAQISRYETAKFNEMEELRQVLTTYNSKVSRIPRGPDEIAANKDVTVAQALDQSATNDADWRKVYDAMQSDITARIALMDEMQKLRQKLQAEKETGNTLRTIITPEPAQVQQGQRAFRDTIASLQVATTEVERRTEAMQPDLYNTAIQLQTQQLRQEGLKGRAKELGIAVR